MLNPQGLHPEAGPQITEMRVRSSENRNVFGFRFPGFAILPEFEADLVALPERSSALERGDVDENVLSTVLRRDETEALVVVEKLYRTGRHDIL